MSIRDRGTKKWTSLFLPEHVKLLRDYFEDEYYQVPKPVLDEQKLEEINEKIQNAIEYTSKVNVTYYKNGYFHDMKGYIQMVDPIGKALYLTDETDIRNKVQFEDIIDLKLL